MVVQTGLAVYRIASDREITLLAAAFAYYAFVSIIPLVLLALVVGSIVGGEELAARLVQQAGDAMPEAGELLLTDALAAEAGRAQATVVAVLVGAWGGLKVFRGLSIAFDRIYGSDVEKSFARHLVDGLATLVTVAGGLALMVAIGYFIGVTAASVPFGRVVGWIGLLAGLVLVFLPIYYVMPPVDISVRSAVPGAVFAAVGWTLLQFGFQLYAANAAQYEAYGAVGGVLLLVTWLYLAGIVILFGAVINVVVTDELRTTDGGAVVAAGGD
ncbi:YihY/virulence factor BrkB family protein [Halovivax limisalsi]|uniref:YihY/virulence factor BrkB family protein n=1 Tax=Halovivax limisalsi TaxID=1453760 RepID=UPI001FFD7D96|nr:YihY/virulence factor BrkB family protein [Halovivax limisalsi]